MKSNKNLTIIAILASISVALLVTILLGQNGIKPRSLTSNLQTNLVFDRTVYDQEQAKVLAALDETIAFAGPLFRSDGIPAEFIEMTPDLLPKGSRELNDNYFYAASKTSSDEITFMGGGCADSSGAWANCSVITNLTPETEAPLSKSTALELDFHEYEPDGHGGYWAIKYSSLVCDSEQTKNCGIDAEGNPVERIGDCHVVHVVNNEIEFNWSAYSALPDGETTAERYGEFQDVFHCNSIDSYEIDGREKFLVSMRNTDSVYQIDVDSGKVDWKIGGNTWKPVSLSIKNPGALGVVDSELKPEDVLSGQHDARYLGDGTYSVFDNGSRTSRPGRGIVFQVNPSEKTATILKVFNNPEPVSSACTGSFTPMAQSRYWVAGWGCSTSGITVFGSDTTPIVSTQLDPNAPSSNEITNADFGPLRWSLSYRVLVE